MQPSAKDYSAFAGIKIPGETVPRQQAACPRAGCNSVQQSALRCCRIRNQGLSPVLGTLFSQLQSLQLCPDLLRLHHLRPCMYSLTPYLLCIFSHGE